MVAKKTKSKKKKSITAKKMCSRVIAREGVKKDGTLKKGYRYVKGGKVVKAKAMKWFLIWLVGKVVLQRCDMAFLLYFETFIIS